MNPNPTTMDCSVKETGAHGPPSKARTFITRAVLLLLALLVSASSWLAGTPAAQAASATTATQHSQEAAANHAARGTSIAVRNSTGEDLRVGDTWLPPNHTSYLSGSSGSGDDVSSSIGLKDGYSQPLYGHNPFAASAYVQIGGQKIFEDKKYFDGKLVYQVSKDSYSALKNQGWSIWVYSDSQRPYDREWVHHTGEDDGVKGFIKNESSRTMHWQSNGHSIELAPGKSLLLFDANNTGYGLGCEFIGRFQDDALRVRLVDPAVGYPKVQVTDADRPLSEPWQDFKEGQTESHHNFRSAKVVIHRNDDGTLDVPHETWNTSDWANFTVTFQDR